MRFVHYNIWLPWSAKIDATPIRKTVVTIIFDGKLWSCKWAYRYESLERTPIWEYPKIGPWFEIMTSVDTDLRSGRRLESHTCIHNDSIIWEKLSTFFKCHYFIKIKYFKFFLYSLKSVSQVAILYFTLKIKWTFLVYDYAEELIQSNLN